ncbi:response regulator [Undibacterium sp. Ren11W]|uniref:response regulator n=1 Tax=Undibacterium sp. Ren11W TaxID=3413045 RepID=UPI003BF3DC0E
MSNAVDPYSSRVKPALPSILLIDDDVFNCEVLVDMLTDLGVAMIHTAHSGAQALEIFNNSEPKPDLLLCDLCMPGMDGFELLTKIAHKRFSGEVVIMSSYDHQAPATGDWALSNYKASALKLAEKLARVQGLKVRATLEKPISRQQLAELMAQLQNTRASF